MKRDREKSGTLRAIKRSNLGQIQHGGRVLLGDKDNYINKYWGWFEEHCRQYDEALIECGVRKKKGARR